MNPTKLLLTFCSLLFQIGIASAQERPNVLIILVDDMGYGDPQCYNPQSKIPTPHIDRLAREGMRFTDAHEPGPLCHPSRYGLLTGRYPFRTDVSVWPKKPLIAAGQMTIASLLESQSYRTAMVGKWHLGFLEDGYEKPLPGGPLKQFRVIRQQLRQWQSAYPELEINIRKSHRGWRQQYRMIDGKPMPFDSDPRAAWNICLQKTCTQLY